MYRIQLVLYIDCGASTMFEDITTWSTFFTVSLAFIFTLLNNVKENRLDKIEAKGGSLADKTKTKKRYRSYNYILATFLLINTLVSGWAARELQKINACKQQNRNEEQSKVLTSQKDILNQLLGSQEAPVAYIDDYLDEGNRKIHIVNLDTLAHFNLIASVVDYTTIQSLFKKTEGYKHVHEIDIRDLAKHVKQSFFPAFAPNTSREIVHNVNFDRKQGAVENQYILSNGQQYIQQIFWDNTGKKFRSFTRIILFDDVNNLYLISYPQQRKLYKEELPNSISFDDIFGLAQIINIMMNDPTLYRDVK